MNIRLKITLLIGFLLLLSLGIIYGQYRLEKDRADLIVQGIIDEQSDFFRSFVDYAGAKLRFFTEDYSFWDDFVDYLQAGPSRDHVWADENITISADNFETHETYIYLPNGEHIYSGDVTHLYEEIPDVEIIPPIFTPTDFALFEKNRLTHFYRMKNGILTDFWVATVHGTTDPDRVTDPEGFLAVGERWDEEHLQEIEDLSGATITEPGEALPPENGVTTISFPLELRDLDGSIAKTYIITAPIPFIGEAQQASENQLFMIIASSLVLLVLIYVFLEILVGKPISALSSSIRNKNIPLMQSMQNDRSEFGALAKLVLNFSEHELVVKAKARDDAVLSAVGSGLMAVDNDGKITLFNTAAESLFKRSAREVIGSRAEDIFKAETPNGTPLTPERYPLMRAMAEKRIVAESLVCIRTDGSKFPAIVTAAPVIHDGAIIGAVQDLRDITEEQMLEQTKSNFVSLVSHELRTPLTLVRWSLEKLKLRADLPKDVLSGVIPPMESAANRTLSLIRAMLDVSKIETNAFETTETELQISTLVDKSLAELQPAIQDKKLTVEIQREQGVETKVISDERLLQIIVNNLLSNATRYAEVGGRVVARLTEEKEKGVTLSVENTGPGIPLEEQPHIFKKMFRGETASRQNPDGSGLGLYITKSFIERLGGSISFESTPGATTTFTVKFPYKYR
ncbi:hypothetical protein A3F55_02870 [Candidatus Adlerbacteria bacterium RIFCSPHIGHO2_12_FULL_53_18]|uniref:histidine kinase n=1 Tax=Candidatus Adlerbacteria bacterium RIFCSPHIGHO2_12_FULL_53_18 TaxID=1797242 RepID=A0A1F4XTA5_9BACT|nr:MAG: hypothetical protein A3F55_02870 [Candidatus Adlerbacteria bacterium RIFCSPHIGHO2_12_FULL_53_18]